MNYKECNKLLELINSGDLDKLKTYVEKEKTKYYLTNAREALKKYLRNSNICFYSNYENGIVLTNGFSGYFLNSDEILTDTYKNKMAMQDVEDIIDKTMLLIKRYREYSNQKYGLVSRVENILPRELVLYSEYDNYSYRFSKDNYEYANLFLGENVTYNLVEDNPVCIVNSPKGKGLIMGMRKK